MTLQHAAYHMTLLMSVLGVPTLLVWGIPPKACCVSRAAKFWIYWAFTFMTLTFFTMYGMMTVAISPNVQVRCLAAVMRAVFSSEHLNCSDL